MLKIGMGYDIHRLAPERKLMLGGLQIPHAQGLLGHSDGDVLIHAVIDAILGACCLGDIGSHFPDHEPQYKDVPSAELLRQVKEKIAKTGRIEHIDSVVVAEEPKLAPHLEAMRARLAALLDISVDKISIKAKTAEGLGPVGEQKAMEAYAVAMIDL
jgi:2-C-methyl-D-erythritol 2,4-cyclodiphosphate synthase